MLVMQQSTSKALYTRFVHRSHTAIRDWILKYKPERLDFRKIKISEFIIDETQLKVGAELIWLCGVTIEPTKDKEILSISISKERNMFVAERFLSNLLKEYDKYPVSTSDGGSWYPSSMPFLKLNHHIAFLRFEKSIIMKRTMQYIKDRERKL